MPLDDVFYCDFNKETKLGPWNFITRTKEKFSAECTLESEGGEFLLLSACQGTFLPDDSPVVTHITLNGCRTDLAHSAFVKTAYMGRSICRYGYRVHLKKGKNEFLIEGDGQSETLEKFMKVSLSDIPEKVEKVPAYRRKVHFEFPEIVQKERSFDTSGFRKGIGCRKAPGRFGFSKGDGLLDFAMPTLGNVDKLYLCGDPRYKKNYRWNYCTLPDGATRHGSYCPSNEGIEKDKIEVNHLSVKWGTRFHDTDYSCTYSLASPGMITESGDGRILLSELEFAGNYRYALLPRENNDYEVVSIEKLSGELNLSRNFLLLFGCSEFPDVPLMLTFTKQPRVTEVRYTQENRLSALQFENCPMLITATPFGFESLEPVLPEDESFLKKAAERCCFWSRALLAYPVDCVEYFRNDEEKESCTVRQQFSYRMIEDEWHTVPLKLAPLPPVLTLCGLMNTPDREDFHFPTKYGYLQGAYGSVSEYTIPLMPTARKFPLKDFRDSALSDLLKDGFDDYLKFVTVFPDTKQSYPYAGALMEPFAQTTTLMNFLSPEDRDRFARIAGEHLAMACEPDRSYDYTIINHGYLMKTMPDDKAVIDYYNNPELAHMKLWNWYERTEPFTGIRFHVCYLNLCFFMSGMIKEGTKEEIANLKIPLVENDWGAGLTFYYMYLCALASGDYSPVRKQWKLLCSIYSFFEQMHDWACCSSGYSDNAILWVEGANYGVYTAFVNLARAVSDQEAYERGMYLAAKQFALRGALMHATQEYFCKFYHVEPWYITKIFSEESNPTWQHQGVPLNLGPRRYRDEAIYNLTTEGMYPEIFDAMRQKHPVEYRELFGRFRALIHSRELPVLNGWGNIQQSSSTLIGMALDPDISDAELKQEIELVRSRGLLMEAWRGIHIYSRRLPKHYLETQLLAWSRMKEHPLWMEHWQDMRILSAEWNGKEALISCKAEPGAMLRLGFRKMPSAVTLNGKNVRYSASGSVLSVYPAKSGMLKFSFV